MSSILKALCDYRCVLAMLLAIVGGALMQGPLLAASPRVEIKPAFREHFVGDAVYIEVTVTAAVGEAVSVIKLDRIYGYPGTFVSTVLDPDGNSVPGGPATLRPPPYIALDHVVGLAGGQALEGRVSLLRELTKPGRHLVRATYRPIGRAGSEHSYEGEIDVVDIQPKHVEVRLIDRTAEPVIEVLKLKSGDEHWLVHKNNATGRVTRIEKIGPSTTLDRKS